MPRAASKKKAPKTASPSVTNMPTRRGTARARYDAAQTTPENRRHWSVVDYLSADAANSSGIRKTLRARARYEVANNSYAKGIVETLANDAIGTGPQLQLEGEDEQNNDNIEAEFDRWAKAVRLSEKLRVMRKAKCQDGEAFAIMVLNKKLDSPIPLDIRIVEADRITDPTVSSFDRENFVDGILYDAQGNPLSYYVLDNHPGSQRFTPTQSYTAMPARQVIHWYRLDRPEQSRGIPEITPALDLFAELRRYTKAVRMAAETAAEKNLYMESNGTPEAGAEDMEDASWNEIEVVRNAMMVLPEGWKMAQLDSKQPATTHSDFVKTILTEVARCLNMPYAVAIGDSSDHNFASGRLDHQVYHRALQVERFDLEITALDRIFARWIEFASLVRDLKVDPFAIHQHQWFWRGYEHVDPAKEASGQKLRLDNLTTNLASECGKEGVDWMPTLRQRFKEFSTMKALMVEFNLTPEDLNTFSKASANAHDVMNSVLTESLKDEK